MFWTMRVRVAAEAATRGPADGTDIAALVGLGADTLADYLTKLLHALFAIIPATTAPNADPRVAASLGYEFPLFGQVALSDLASASRTSSWRSRRPPRCVPSTGAGASA